MKKAMKKLMAALLAVAMVCAMAIPAFADKGNNKDNKGSITIGNAVVGEDYTIYKMFDLTSFDTDADTYSYTVVDAWKDFFKTSAAGSNYIKLENGHPTWVGGGTAEDYEQFAKAALDYATKHSITATAKDTATSTTVKFDNLDLGYYLVDTSLGVLCGLNTTAPNVTINEKNQAPTIDKTVETSPNNWAASNTAKIGDTVNYKVTITVQTANNHYVLHDTMSEGLTFNKDSVKVTVNNDNVAASGHYTLVTEGLTDGETLNIKFEDSYIATLAAGTKIEVTYSAVVNEKAKVDSDENKNEAHLVYGNNHKTESTHSETKTYLYQFDLVKYCGTSGKLLGGAQFKLYDANGTEIKLVKNEDGTYRVATAEEKPVDYILTVEGQTVRISGLDKKVYYLEETVPPAGYNRLTERVTVDLSTGSKKADLTKIIDGKIDVTDVTNVAHVGGVPVMNNAGTTLPSTGGIGTTLFYVIGGGLMVAAAILLITKKRMENR